MSIHLKERLIRGRNIELLPSGYPAEGHESEEDLEQYVTPTPDPRPPTHIDFQFYENVKTDEQPDSKLLKPSSSTSLTPCKSNDKDTHTTPN